MTSKELGSLISSQLQEILQLHRLRQADAQAPGEEPGKTEGRTSRSRKP